MTSSQTAAAIETATLNCAREPIQIPGSVQPHGFMMVFDAHATTLLQVSANVERWLGAKAAQVLEQPLDAWLEDAAAVIASLQAMPEDAQHPAHLRDVKLRGGLSNQPVALIAHRYDGVVIAEFEPVRDASVAYSQLYPLVRSFISRVNTAGTIDEMCLRAVQEVKRVVGFGRVKSYRFDAEGNGMVNAELIDPGYPSYLGLWFPASDIPQQARELYCANRIRVIQDVDYQPSPLVPAFNPQTGKPLDLSFATLRSVSPVHLQYMRNMGTQASMSISIVVDGRLWGLISCHNDSPRAVDFQMRAACELLGSVLSLQVETHETHESNEQLLTLRHKIVQLLSAMADRDSVTEGLRTLSKTFIGFARADGAAIVQDEQYDLLGSTPPAPLVTALVGWLSKRDSNEVFATDNVGRDIPELPELAGAVGGVLAVAISEIHSHYLIWFKPERAHTVDWAGLPYKSISEQGHLDPRHSFERWQEQVRGFSSPWHPLEIEGVWELRTAVLGIVLRKAEELAQLASELRKSNKELEAFSYSVSHDLRAPLRHIAGYAELLGDLEGGQLSERGVRFLGNIGDSARFAGSLVDNLLSFSQMGRSALRFSDVDLFALVNAIRQQMQPDYLGRDVQWVIDPLPLVIADAAFLNLALRNLVSNALKYSRDRSPAVIEIGVMEQANEHVVFVRDNGVGFDMQYAGKLFGVFQRLHRMEEFEGTGIGLASVRRIIERHDGKVWANSEPGQGATFYFTLPHRRHPAEPAI